MQKESYRLLEDEARELEDSLESALFSQVSKAIDVNHAVLILLEKGLINKKVVRNLAIIYDFDMLYKNPLNKVMDIYRILSVKYNQSETLIRDIIRGR